MQYTSGYQPLQFAITTGPAPVPRLDGTAIVFGEVLEGRETISKIVAVPTFNPGEKVKAFNALGKLARDDRAEKTRRKWGSPLKAVVVLRAEVA